MGEITEEQKERLLRLAEIADTLEAGLRMMQILGTIVKWVVGLGSSVAIIWGAIHGGSPK